MARLRRAYYASLTATFKKRADAVERMRANDSRMLGGRTTVKGAARLQTVQLVSNGLTIVVCYYWLTSVGT